MPDARLEILIVDDDPTLARSIARTLHLHRATVETDPAAALQRVRGGERFDVILCDARMPVVDGAGVLAASRELSDPPIFILMSAYDDLGDVDADAVLYKPFHASQLLGLIAVLIARRRGHAPESTQA